MCHWNELFIFELNGIIINKCFTNLDVQKTAQISTSFDKKWCQVTKLPDYQ